MKLKYNFVIREIDSTTIAVAIGEDALNFNGMIKLNETGAFIFALLFNDITLQEITDKLATQYGITQEKAMDETLSYIQYLQDEDLIVE